MKVSIYTSAHVPANGGLSYEEKLRVLKDVGFTSICLSFTQHKADFEVSKADQVKLADKYGFEVDAVHLSGAKMTTIWSESEDAEFVTQRAIDELTELKELGLKTGVIHVTWGHDVPEPVSDSALARFRRIAEAADSLQVQVALENSVYPEHVHFVLENLKNPYMGFCYDSGHENAFSPGENYLDRYGHRLFAMHIHDNHGTDEHNLPFNGTIDWKHVMSQLRKTELFNTKGIALECGARDMDYRTHMQQAYESVQRLMTL